MDWTIQDVGALGESISAIAVLFTLIYLSVQIRQTKKATEANTRALRGSASWDAEIIFAQRNHEAAYDAAFSDLIERAYNPTSDLATWNQTDRNKIMFDTISCFQMVQAQYFLWREGSLPEDIWSYRSNWMRRAILLPVIGVYWRQFRASDILSEAFMDYIESIEVQEHAPFPTGLDQSNE
jgi:hypothetical protein